MLVHSDVRNDISMDACTFRVLGSKFGALPELYITRAKHCPCVRWMCVTSMGFFTKTKSVAALCYDTKHGYLSMGGTCSLMTYEAKNGYFSMFLNLHWRSYSILALKRSSFGKNWIDVIIKYWMGNTMHYSVHGLSL